MKNWTKFIALSMFVVALGLTSCSDDGSPQQYYPVIATCKTDQATKHAYLQVTKNETFYPENVSDQLFGGKELRAYCYLKLDPKKQTPGFDYTGTIAAIDSIRTKDVLKKTAGFDPERYGNDPIDIVSDWMSVAEDGYLTLRLRSLWNMAPVHYVNLIWDSEKPTVFELRHDACGDIQGVLRDGLIAFRLPQLPTGTKAITVAYKSFNGPTAYMTFPLNPDDDKMSSFTTYVTMGKMGDLK